MTKFFYTIRFPLIAEVINSALVQVVGTEYGVFAYPLVTTAIVLWAGALIARESWGSLAHAAWAGPAIMFFGVLVVGIFGAFSSPLSLDELKDIPERAQNAWAMENPRLAGFMGLVLATAIFTPVAALISALGGFIGKRLGTADQ
jgi:hypothetical protein